MYLIAAFVVLLIGGGGVVLSLVPKSPTISFERTQYDYGEMAYGEVKEAQFPFKNTGKEILKIEKIQADCSCVIPQLTKREYHPFEEGLIEISFRAEGKANERIEKSVAVISNDPDKSLIQIKIVGTMRNVLTIVPRKINMGTIHVGESPSINVSIGSINQLDDFRLTDIVSSYPGIEFTVYDPLSEQSRQIPQGIFDGGRYSIKVDMPILTVKGPISENITIHTTSRKNPRIDIPIEGHVTTSFRINPPELLFIPREGKVSKEIQIANDIPFSLAMKNNALLTCQIEQEETFSKNRTILLQINAFGNVTQKGVLTLEVMGHDLEKEIQIPFTILEQEIP